MSTGIDYGSYSYDLVNKYGKYAQYTTNANSSASNNATKTVSTSSTSSTFANISGNTCTDGCDDGKIGFFSAVGNALEGVGKGIVNCVKGGFTNSEGHFSLLQTAKTVAMGAACFLPVVGPALGAVLACYGIYNGAKTVITAAQVANNATTDAEAKAAWEQIGSGTLTTGLSIVGLKASAGALRSQLSANTSSATVQAVRAKSSTSDVIKIAAQETKGNMYNAAYATLKKAQSTLEKTGKFIEHPIETTKGMLKTAQAKVKGWGETAKNKADKCLDSAKTKAEQAKQNAETKAANEKASVEKAKQLAKDNNIPDTDCYDNGVPKQIKDGNTTTTYNQNGTPKNTVEVIADNCEMTINGEVVKGQKIREIKYDSNGQRVSQELSIVDSNGKKISYGSRTYSSDGSQASQTLLNKDGTAKTTYQSSDKNGFEVRDSKGKVKSCDITETKTAKNGTQIEQRTQIDANGTIKEKTATLNGETIEHSYKQTNAKGETIKASSSKTSTGKSGSSYKTESTYNPTTKKTDTTITVGIGEGGEISNPTAIDKVFAKIDSGKFGDFTSSKKLTPEFVFENPELVSELSVLLDEEDTINY